MAMNQPLSDELEAKAQELAKRIRERADDEILELARLLVSKEDSEIFGDTEFEARDIVHRIGAEAFEERLKKNNGYQSSGVDCPTCHQNAKFQGYRRKRPIGLMGMIDCSRGYYYCGKCGHGIFPWDQSVGLTACSFTPATARLVSLAGTLSDGFEEASKKVLPEMAGLNVAETTVQLTTEAVGSRIAEHRRQGDRFGFPNHWNWRRDAHGRTCAYVSLDLTGVRQQAKDGGAAECRMPYVAMVFNPVPELPKESPYRPDPKATMQARYLSGLYNLDELGVQLRKQAGEVGMDHADVWIGITDGGNGLEEFVRKNFNREPELILDFWHAAEYLTELGKVLHPHDETVREETVANWRHTMKHEGGQRILEIIEELPIPPRKRVLKEKRAEVINYFQNNVHRMDYPRYVANGWSIGSGAVESACKTVVGQRLKLAGMRWREYGTDSMCHIRALYKSEQSQWQAFWQRKIHKKQAA